MDHRQSPIANHGGEINVAEYWRVIVQRKKMIGCIVALASILAVIVSLMEPNTYRAEAVIVPVSAKGGGSGSLSSLASQFGGGLSALIGMTSSSVSGEADKFMVILKSRTLAENVIVRENLMPVLFKDAWDEKTGRWKSDDPKKQPTMASAVSMMRGLVTAFDDKKDKSIKIAVVSRSPDFSARIANAYVDELQNSIKNNAFTNAKRNRIFIEGQIESNKREFLEASKEVNDFYRGGRISSAETKIDVSLNSDILPPNEDSSRFVFNDEVADHGQEINSLVTQRADIDRKIADAKIVKNVPQQVYFGYLVLRRELLGKVSALLTTQYEMAKIEESKEDLAFQVIDGAVPPVGKYKPSRSRICMGAFIVSLFLAILLAFLMEYFSKMKTPMRDL